MKFRLKTLIDITETGARRTDEDKFAYKQEANFQTMLQTIGLRVNIEYKNKPRVEEINISKLEFGDKYKGKQRVWTFDFNVDYEGGLNTEMLDRDFDLIPIILELTETAKIEQAVFRTTPEDRNVIFSIIE